MKPSKIAAVSILALVVLVSGCIGSGGENPDRKQLNETIQDEVEENNEDRGPREIVIKNDGKSFVPEEVEVEKGREIEFVFKKTSGTHNLRIPELNKGTGTLTYESNETFSVTFKEEGEYDFICSIGTHAQQGMNGTITVS